MALSRGLLNKKIQVITVNSKPKTSNIISLSGVGVKTKKGLIPIDSIEIDEVPVKTKPRVLRVIRKRDRFIV